MSPPASSPRSAGFPRLIGFVVAGLAAAALGFNLGRFSLPPNAATPEKPSSVSAAPAATSVVSAPPLPRPALTAPDFPAQLDELLATLASPDKSTLLATLQRVTGEASWPPVLRTLYRRELMGRLVAVGAGREAMACGDVRDREEAARIVVELVAKTDPAAAQALIDDSLSPAERRAATGGLMFALGETNPKLGLEWIRSRPELREAGGELFRSWTKRDPKAAAAAVREMITEGLPPVYLHQVAYEWSTVDVDAAFAWAQTLPPNLRSTAQGSAMNALVNRDPAAALTFALAHPENGDQFADWIGARLGGSDPAAAEALLNEVPPGRFRTRLIGGIVRELVNFDPAAALEWTKTLLPGERTSALKQTFHFLAFEDPAVAIRLAQKHLAGPDATAAIVATASEWAQNDFPAAVAALAEAVPTEDLRPALSDLMPPSYAIFGQDPAEQVAAIRRLGPELQADALRHMGMQWGMINPGASEPLLASLAPAERTAFLDGWLGGISGGSAELVKRLLPSIPPEVRTRRAHQITRSLASQDPAAAADFLLGLDAPLDQRQPAMEDLAGEWASVDPAAAIAFAGRVPPGAARDAVTLALARQLKEFALDDATRQLAAVSDPASRTRLIGEVAPRWRRVDPERGRALLLAAARSDAERRAINEALGGKP